MKKLILPYNISSTTSCLKKFTVLASVMNETGRASAQRLINTQREEISDSLKENGAWKLKKRAYIIIMLRMQ